MSVKERDALINYYARSMNPDLAEFYEAWMDVGTRGMHPAQAAAHIVGRIERPPTPEERIALRARVMEAFRAKSTDPMLLLMFSFFSLPDYLQHKLIDEATSTPEDLLRKLNILILAKKNGYNFEALKKDRKRLSPVVDGNMPPLFCPDDMLQFEEANRAVFDRAEEIAYAQGVVGAGPKKTLISEVERLMLGRARQAGQQLGGGHGGQREATNKFIQTKFLRLAGGSEPAYLNVVKINDELYCDASPVREALTQCETIVMGQNRTIAILQEESADLKRQIERLNQQQRNAPMGRNYDRFDDYEQQHYDPRQQQYDSRQYRHAQQTPTALKAALYGVPRNNDGSFTFSAEEMHRFYSEIVSAMEAPSAPATRGHNSGKRAPPVKGGGDDTDGDELGAAAASFAPQVPQHRGGKQNLQQPQQGGAGRPGPAGMI